MIQTLGATLWGLDGLAVSVEIDTGRGLPCFHIVGQPDRVISESRDRIRAAFRRCGLEFPAGRVSVNLAPSERPKSGSGLDLAIAVGVAAAVGAVSADEARRALLIGELGFDGSLRPVRGTLALASAALDLEPRIDTVLVPTESGPEAALCPDIEVRAAPDLGSVLAHLRGGEALPLQRSLCPQTPTPPSLDLRDVFGQETAKRALEIAAAGPHSLLMVGPPGSGKTLLASQLPGLLPDLDSTAALEVARIHSVAGAGPPLALSRRPPLRAPHHTISEAGFSGGGRPIRPGELSLAHRGVLFLDELPEFRRGVLECLRQPLEDGHIHIARAHASHIFPARVHLVAAMNPCPCGFRDDPVRECRCDPTHLRRYRTRLSGPLLDRLDLHVSVPPVSRAERTAALSGSKGRGPSTEQVRARIRKARELCPERDGEPAAHATRASAVRREQSLWKALDPPDRSWLDSALERLGLSMRSAGRILRVAHTIARLEARERPERNDLAEAVSYRWLDRLE